MGHGHFLLESVWLRICVEKEKQNQKEKIPGRGSVLFDKCPRGQGSVPAQSATVTSPWTQSGVSRCRSRPETPEEGTKMDTMLNCLEKAHGDTYKEAF